MPFRTPTLAMKDELWLTIQRYIVAKRIHCAEATIEDRVYESAPTIIEELCDIVGYTDCEE